MKVFKKIAYIVLAIVICLCVAIDIWFLYIKFFAPEKLVENTYESGLQTTTGGDKKSFVEVKYSTNENKNGLECFDLKFNYLLDENQDAFYSQGIQFVANERTQSIEWQYYLDEDQPYISWSEGHWYDFEAKVTHYGYFGGYNITDAATAYNYASGNDYADTIISSNPINDDTSFRIQLGEDLYKMKFKGTTKEFYDDNNLYASQYTGANIFGNKAFNNYYFYYNVYSFAYKIYEGVKDSISNGKQSSVLFELGDMFEYYKYDESQGAYENTAVEDSTKIISDMTSYYSILVYKTADGARKASDSLFNCIQGNCNYNSVGDYSLDDYFIGRTIVKCDIYDFQIIEMSEDLCALKLKTEFIDNYIEDKNKICLSIWIDKEILKQIDINYFVFSTDSGLDNFDVYECYLTEIVDGKEIKTGVAV